MQKVIFILPHETEDHQRTVNQSRHINHEMDQGGYLSPDY